MARCYFIPLKLVSWGGWRKINHSARAILPVIGLHADKNGRSFPGIKLISKLSGVHKAHNIHKGLKSLIENELLVKEKEGRHNVYYLVNQAIVMGGSYFPMGEYLFKEDWWAKLLPCEKAVFVVLAVKASIDDSNMPDEFNEEFEEGKVHAHGILQPTKWTRLAGISNHSWYSGIYGLVEHRWIGLTENNEYIIYK